MRSKDSCNGVGDRGSGSRRNLSVPVWATGIVASFIRVQPSSPSPHSRVPLWAWGPAFGLWEPLCWKRERRWLAGQWGFSPRGYRGCDGKAGAEAALSGLGVLGGWGHWSSFVTFYHLMMSSEQFGDMMHKARPAQGISFQTS